MASKLEMVELRCSELVAGGSRHVPQYSNLTHTFLPHLFNVVESFCFVPANIT